jgi:ketosteroid isomerase-like protein
MISSGPLEDRLAIRELVESYNDAVMRFDAEAWGANWSEDAHWSVPGLADATGRAAIVAQWQQAMAAFDCVGFFASAGPLVVEHQHARGTWYQQEFLYFKDGTKRVVIGRYDDEYVKQSGRWYFRKRSYSVLKAE